MALPPGDQPRVSGLARLGRRTPGQRAALPGASAPSAGDSAEHEEDRLAPGRLAYGRRPQWRRQVPHRRNDRPSDQRERETEREAGGRASTWPCGCAGVKARACAHVPRSRGPVCRMARRPAASSTSPAQPAGGGRSGAASVPAGARHWAGHASGLPARAAVSCQAGRRIAIPSRPEGRSKVPVRGPRAQTPRQDTGRPVSPGPSRGQHMPACRPTATAREGPRPHGGHVPPGARPTRKGASGYTRAHGCI